MTTIMVDQEQRMVNKYVDSVVQYLNDVTIPVPVRMKRVRAYVMKLESMFEQINWYRNKLYNRYFQAVVLSYSKKTYSQRNANIEAWSVQELQKLDDDERRLTEEYNAVVSVFADFVQNQRALLIREYANLRLFR